MMFCINDIRLIVDSFIHITVQDNNQPKELLNPTVLYKGRLEDLTFNDIVAKETIVQMMPWDSELIIFINHKT